MKNEAVDYGYLPKNIRDRLRPFGNSVSKQIVWLITSGAIGPEGFIVSLRTARSESVYHVQTAPTLRSKQEYLALAAQYVEVIRDPNQQKLVCEMMMDDCNGLHIRAVMAGDKMSVKFYKQAAQNWLAVRGSIGTEARRGALRLVQ